MQYLHAEDSGETVSARVMFCCLHSLWHYRYTELCLDKDIQMLAMMSVVLLRLAVELRMSDGVILPLKN